MEIPGALFAHNPGNPAINDSKLRVRQSLKVFNFPPQWHF